jgi:hypothetical protein
MELYSHAPTCHLGKRKLLSLYGAKDSIGFQHSMIELHCLNILKFRTFILPFEAEACPNNI